MADNPADRILTPAALDAGYASARREIGRFNLGLFGMTGVGKSTLLNAVFGVELAGTGIGAPVTQTAHLYRYESSTVGIYDTKGLELGSELAAMLNDLRGFVDRNRIGPVADQIHVIWYCIRAGDNRIQPAEVAFIRSVSAMGIPAIIVMTQTPVTPDGQIHADARTLAEQIRELALPMRGDVHFVSALGDTFAGVPPHGLDALLETTSEVAPEGVRNALAAAQIVNQRLKRERASDIVNAVARRLSSQIVHYKVDDVWAQMLAGVAEVYDVPEARAREVVAEVGTVLRARRMLYVRNARIFVPGYLAVSIAVTVAKKLRTTRANKAGDSTVANASGEPQGSLSKRRKWHVPWRKAAAVQGSHATGSSADQSWFAPVAQSGASGAGEPSASAAGATVGAASEQRRTTLGTGLQMARVTQALGEAWVDTCDHYWQESFPERATYADTHGIADYFADEFSSRLPKLVRRMDDWLERHAD